jgi:hypothetical protein
MQQLETNAKEMDTVNEELGVIETSENENYETFTDSLNNKRRTESEQLASDVLKNAKTIDEAKKEALKREETEKAKQAAAQSDGKKVISNIISKLTPNVEITITSKTQTTMNEPTNHNKNSNLTKKPSALESILPETVDEFNKFLDDTKVTENITKIQLNNSIDSDEDDNKNPMVINYCENIDLSDDESVNSGKKFKPVILNQNSSDDETKKISTSIKTMDKSPNSDKQFLSRNKIEVNIFLF